MHNAEKEKEETRHRSAELTKEDFILAGVCTFFFFLARGKEKNEGMRRNGYAWPGRACKCRMEKQGAEG